MLAEGIHSLADTGDQLLMILGIKRSREAPDEEHPFGYGMEIYFWGFMVAIVLFSIGGGVSIYEGILKLRSSHAISNVGWNYLVLGVATLQKPYLYERLPNVRHIFIEAESWKRHDSEGDAA